MMKPMQSTTNKIFTGFNDEEDNPVEWMHVIRVADHSYGVYDAVVEYANSLGAFVIKNYDVIQVKNPPGWDARIKKHPSYQGEIWPATNSKGFVIYPETLIAKHIRSAGVTFKIIGKIDKIYRDEATVGGKDWKVIYTVNGNQYEPKVGFDYDRGAMLFGLNQINQKHKTKEPEPAHE